MAKNAQRLDSDGYSVCSADNKPGVQLQPKPSVQHLRDLTSRLHAAQERERSRLARELHDETGQALTTLKLTLCRLRDSSAGEQIQRHEFDQLIATVDDLIDGIQRITTELQPALLDQLGCSAACRWQIGQFRNTTGIDCRCKWPDCDARLDDELAIALFRILQEALTNVARHAQASQVDIVLTSDADADTLRLRLDDNGKGIDFESQLMVFSGIIGMQERARSVGGSLRISRRPGGGTRILATFPLAAQSWPEHERRRQERRQGQRRRMN